MPISYDGQDYRMEAAIAILIGKVPDPESQAGRCIESFAAEIRRKRQAINRGMA